MQEDQELKVMATISETLVKLDEAAVGRVLRWAADRFKVPITAKPPERGEAGEGGAVFQDFADLYDRTNPSTDSEKALVAGYWFQVSQGQQDLDAQRVNAELKNLGHGVGNITDALSGLMKRAPRLVMQTRKSGSTRQARKKYRLTVEGTRRVEEMLSGKPEKEA